MKTNRCRSTVAVILAAALLPLPVAQAQLGDLLQQGEGSGSPDRKRKSLNSSH